MEPASRGALTPLNAALKPQHCNYRRLLTYARVGANASGYTAALLPANGVRHGLPLPAVVVVVLSSVRRFQPLLRVPQARWPSHNPHPGLPIHHLRQHLMQLAWVQLKQTLGTQMATATACCRTYPVRAGTDRL
jgi:hypothetical protein